MDTRHTLEIKVEQLHVPRTRVMAPWSKLLLLLYARFKIMTEKRVASMKRPTSLHPRRGTIGSSGATETGIARRKLSLDPSSVIVLLFSLTTLSSLLQSAVVAGSPPWFLLDLVQSLAHGCLYIYIPDACIVFE